MCALPLAHCPNGHSCPEYTLWRRRDNSEVRTGKHNSPRYSAAHKTCPFDPKERAPAILRRRALGATRRSTDPCGCQFPSDCSNMFQLWSIGPTAFLFAMFRCSLLWNGVSTATLETTASRRMCWAQDNQRFYCVAPNSLHIISFRDLMVSRVLVGEAPAKHHSPVPKRLKADRPPPCVQALLDVESFFAFHVLSNSIAQKSLGRRLHKGQIRLLRYLGRKRAHCPVDVGSSACGRPSRKCH